MSESLSQRTIYIEPSLWQDIGKLAKENFKSRSAYIVDIMNQHVKANPPKKGKKKVNDNRKSTQTT